ncbi:lysozyme inhibitor LprI family protein [Beggiatoa leptomitoformis]|uniref:DUF1311 domain-containing protein n=1 Tax=Beggiatoa leptomitoformis TaxID=288004 RepID=A0A2N9YAM7_9GAMM|nr:lysozyme inhibitor LprI family protein [Beggiatoa leptomitoformis]ALG69325.2 DUF1311 domain-containing protein [Beggiatoa leptomitoformis]AUI67518.1 DUF1311 domain-containing protein [Beggiatoa leptomitoformis]
MRSLILFGFIVCSISAFAKDTPDVDCENPQGTYEENYCVELSYKAADDDLNTTYKKVMKNDLTAEQKALLVTAQKSWIKFRDDHCEFATYNARGGTGFAAFLSGCLRDITLERTAELNAILDAPE